MNLNRANAPISLRIGASASPRTGIVHLGLGQFHRAHMAVNTALALPDSSGDWGIVGVANKSRSVIDSLIAQDYLYSVLQLLPGDESVGLVDVHRAGLVAAQQKDEVLSAIAEANHRIISLTISEKGYHRGPTGEIDLDSFGGEVHTTRPTTPIGLLARGLERRAQIEAPVTVLSCDNIQGNGAATRDVVLAYLQAANASDTTLEWIYTHVTFPGTMVDRIVPGTTDATRAKVEALLGLRDSIPVPAERFSMWVMEDHFAAGRPQWEAAGAIFSDEVHRYELVKLRILNGMHSLISYLGALQGANTIASARANDLIAESVQAAIYDECLPSIELPTGFDFDSYVKELFDRWSNTSLADQTARVGSDGSAKLLQRIPDPALTALTAGRTPHFMALTLASWLACVCPPEGFNPGPVAAEMDEPLRDQLIETVRGAHTGTDRIQKVLDAYFPANLAGARSFVERAGELFDIITTSDVNTAIKDALAARTVSASSAE